MENKLNIIQNGMFDIASFLHDFCVKNNIEYSICGGTLLGSIRHEDFIPWDDDFDIFMPRDSFNKFLSLWIDTDKYEIAKSGDEFYYKVCTPAKIFIKNTIVIEHGEEEDGVDESYFAQGIFVDVFPIDKYPNNFIGKFINKYLGKINMKKSQSRFPMYTRSKSVRLFIKLFFLIPNSFINLLISLSLRYLKNHKSKSFFIGYGVETSIDNLRVDSDVIYPFKLSYKIKDKIFYGPANYHSYLNHRFGDYMKIPDTNNQRSHIKRLFVDGVEIN